MQRWIMLSKYSKFVRGCHVGVLDLSFSQNFRGFEGEVPSLYPAPCFLPRQLHLLLTSIYVAFGNLGLPDYVMWLHAPIHL